MSDLPMTREQIEEELAKCGATISRILFAEHILRIGTIELREEKKTLRILLSEVVEEIDDCSDPGSWDFYEKAKDESKKDADNFFKEGLPF